MAVWKYGWRKSKPDIKKRSETADTRLHSYLIKDRKRRDLIFFNPTFNREVKTDIGRQFLRLIDKNFPSNDQISELINRKTVKRGKSDIIT